MPLGDKNNSYSKHTPSQLRLEASAQAGSNRGLAPVSGTYGGQRVGSQYSNGTQLSSLGQPLPVASNQYRNQYSQQALSHQNGQEQALKVSSGPVINTHNRHGLIEVNRRNGPGQGGASWW